MDTVGASAYYRKWRSQSFADLVGQDAIARTLRNAVRTGRVAHAYLFCGPRGVGKTSAARILAKAINCPNVVDGEPCAICDSCRAIQDGQAIDVIELDAASNRGIDQMREILDRVGLAPAVSRFKIYILDEAHMLTEFASNALLKTLEEPPPHAIFVLATTDAQKLPETILSRCQRLDFRRIGASDSVARLAFVCRQEGITPEAGVLELLARVSSGSLRDAEGALDQVVSYAGSQPSLSQTRSILGVAGPDAARELVGMVLAEHAEAAIRFVNRLVDDGSDPRQVALDVVDTLRNLLLVRTSEALLELIDESEDGKSALRQLAAQTSARRLVELIRIFTPAPVAARAGFRPQLPLEISVVDAISQHDDPVTVPSPARPPAMSPALANRVAEPAPPRRPEVTIREAPSTTTAREVAPIMAPTVPATVPEPPAYPATPSPQEPVRSSGIGGAAFLDLAQRKWPEILEASGGKSKSIQALLRSARPVELDGEYLILGFTYPFHRERIEDVKNRGIVEEVIERIVGQKTRIRCSLISREAMAASDPISAVMDDPLVRAAVAMGARVRTVLDDQPEENR